MLQILDIKKSFGDLHVLRGVDLTVEKGDALIRVGGRAVLSLSGEIYAG